MMKQKLVKRIGLGTLLLCGLGLAAGSARAQFLPGFTPGGTTGGGTGGTRSTQVGVNPVGGADISVDTERRNLILVTDEKTAAQIKTVVAGIDKPAPQVLIKVVFLEATYSKDSDIGLAGTYTRNSGLGSAITNLNMSQAFGNGIGGSAATLAAPGAGIYSILGNDFQVTLRAIADAGKTEVLSRPSVLARNNQQATISLGQQVPLITATRFDTLGNQINTVSYQNVGIGLTVTPFIMSDGMVEMVVTPQISELADRSQWVPISGGTNGAISAPVINQRTATTTVVVPDSQTVVIGGLMENQVQDSESKVPVLGDIPLLGWAFKRKIKSNVKRELMIFLTPHIVAHPSQLAAMTSGETANQSIAPKAFSEQELNRFLDKLPMKGGEPSKNTPAPKDDSSTKGKPLLPPKQQ